MDEPNSPVSDENGTLADSPSKRSWFEELLVYVLHCFAATYGVTMTTFIIGAVAYAAAKDSPVLNILNPMFVAPFYVFFILFGVFAGGFMYRRFLSVSAMFVWVLPGIFFAWNVHDYWSRGGFHLVWHNLLGTGCQGECWEVFIVVPFYASIAYSVGALVERRRRPASW